MFLGHFGVGFALKRAAPRASLGTLFLSAQFVDLLWPTLLLLGVERVSVVPGITRVTPLDFEYYPISHSLLMGFAWGLAIAGCYWLWCRYGRGAIVCGVAVLSHWFLDALVHRPDLPLFPGGHALAGMSLWNSFAATIFLEMATLGTGVWLYVNCTTARDRTGRWALWALLLFLVIVFVGNLTGPPPPDSTAIGWVGQAQWLLVAWGYWIDRHRRGQGSNATAA